MSNLLSARWQFTPVSIRDDVGSSGTGVLIAATQPSTDPDDRWAGWENPVARAYVATAAHVLGTNASVIESTYSFFIRYNSNGPRGLERREFEFVVQNSPANWAVHPDPAVDVAVLDVTDNLGALEAPAIRFCPLHEVANPVSILEMDVDAGDEVFVLGYPLALRQGTSNLPIIRKGVLATSPRRPLADANGTELRGFLVDGAIMPGSSGSPVISTSTRFRNGDLALTPHRALLLGVVVEEWHRGTSQPQTGGVAFDAYANLGYAHSASTIIETIVALGHNSPEDFLRLDHDDRWAPQLGVPEWALEFDGREVDSITADRIMMRLFRDRTRASGQTVRPSRYHDAVEIMGPVT